MFCINLLTALIATSSISNAQGVKTAATKAEATTTIKSADKTQEYSKKYDFTDLLKPENKFLGFIAPNYKRMDIDFVTVKKQDDKTYQVEGTSTVDGNTCSFAGPITITKISQYPKAVMNEELKDIDLKGRGELTAKYEFKEQQKEKVCGAFKGQMTLYWYVDGDGEIQYDDLEESMSDNYKNNQYKGTWTAYGDNKSKKANWGEYRIPDSGDLDIGAGEFGVNPKYKDNGW